jgi:hypothetical protein
MSKKFKILRLSHIFTPSEMAQIVSGIENFSQFPYCKQMALLADMKVDNCAALSRELRKIGHEVVDVYFDLEVPQKKWAEENEVKWEYDNWQTNILLKQIETIKPEILFIQKTTRLNAKILHKLKISFPFIKKIILHSAYLGNLGHVGYVDVLLAGTPSLVDRFQRQGYKPKLFYHYFDSEILEISREAEIDRHYPITFLGSSGFGGGYLHADRYETLCYLMERTPIEAWVNEPKSSKPNYSFRLKMRNSIKNCMEVLPISLLRKTLNSQIFPDQYLTIVNECLREKEFHLEGRKLPSNPIRSLFKNRCHDALMGLEYYKVMAKSKISFTKACNNIYDGKSCQKGDIGALRLFEATGLGSCLVADTGPNMGDLFEEGKEIITYSSNEDAVEKINYLLSNENHRKEIAKAGQLRTLKDHTAAVRAVEFDWILQS